MKKTLSFIIACIFIMTACMACFPGMGVQASTINLSDSDYENAKKLLTSVCSEFPLDNAEVTTRAEFVAAVVKALNMPKSTVSDTGFSDVASTDKYAAEISYARGLELISNVDLFYPNVPVTYAQAIKIVMCAAGYGKKAEFQGGFPTGYLAAARQAEVGVGINLGNDDSISHSVAISLIFDAVCTDMMELSSYGTEYDYTVTQGKNILSTYHGIYVATGIMDASEHTGLYGASDTAGEGFIRVNGKNFRGEGYENLIGKNVRVFYKEENKNSIIYAYECANTSYTYTNEDALVLSGNVLTVSPANAEKDVRHSLEEDFAFIYNGKCYGSADYSSLINPTAGFVTLIDNDENKKIDVVVVKEIEYGVVASVNEFEEKIYDRFKKNGMISLGADGGKYYVSDSEGNALKLYELEPDHVVGYVRSKDGKLCEIIRYTDRVGGAFEGKTADGKIVVAGKEYSLSKYYTDNVKSMDELKLGIDVIVHLGVSGQVIYIQEFSTSLKYGFIMASGQEKGLDGDVKVMICSQDGSVSELSVADKVRYDDGTGLATISKNEAKTKLERIASDDILLRVVKYATNADGKLNKLYEAVPYSGNVGDAFLKEKVDESCPILYSDNTQHEASGQTVFYKSGVFFPLFHLSPGASILQVPVDETNRLNKDYYTSHTASSLSDYAEDVSENVKCFGYDVDKNGANFVLWTLDGSGGTSVSEESASGIVESVTTGVNPDGEEVKIIKLYYNKTWAKFYSMPEAEYPVGSENTIKAINTMKPGDIIRISKNSDNEITAAEINFSYSGNTELGIPEKGIVSSYKNQVYGGRVAGYVSGYIYSVANKKAMIVRDKTLDEIEKGAFELKNLHAATMASGTVVFVKFNRDRQTGAIKDAVVYTEKDPNVAQSYFSAGKEADFLVQRSRYLSVSLTVVYVD